MWWTDLSGHCWLQQWKSCLIHCPIGILFRLIPNSYSKTKYKFQSFLSFAIQYTNHHILHEQQFSGSGVSKLHLVGQNWPVTRFYLECSNQDFQSVYHNTETIISIVGQLWPCPSADPTRRLAAGTKGKLYNQWHKCPVPQIHRSALPLFSPAMPPIYCPDNLLSGG